MCNLLTIDSTIHTVDSTLINLGYALSTIDGDSDCDGLTDGVDNCSQVANADQRDTNGDGFGNMCDADLSNDGLVNITDYLAFRSAWLSTGSGLDADFNGDDVVNVGDYLIFRSSWLLAPGPSALDP